MSQLHRLAGVPPRRELEGDFWNSFTGMVGRLADENYFTRDWPQHCQDGMPFGMDCDAVIAAMREELGIECAWPKEEPASTPAKLDMIELFFRHVAEPSESWYHQYCGSNHPESYNVANGRYRYTIEVNNIFNRLKYAYRLQKGRVRQWSSDVLDSEVWQFEMPITTDQHLLGLLSQCFEAYYDRSTDRRRQALMLLVDAFERTKTLIDPEDKRMSATALVELMSPRADEDVVGQYDQLMRLLTKIGNTHGIRHHEVGQIEELSDELVAMLFHVYFSVVRFALQCIARQAKETGTELCE